MKKYWRLWAKAIGEKEGITNAEADKIAVIRRQRKKDDEENETHCCSIKRTSTHMAL